MAEYIEREAAIRNIREMASVIGFENPAVAIDCAVKCLERVPAADVAPVVHGRWEAQKYWKYKNKHSIQYHTNRCSLCHCDVSSRLLYNYCPNCRAKMKDGE